MPLLLNLQDPGFLPLLKHIPDFYIPDLDTDPQSFPRFQLDQIRAIMAETFLALEKRGLRVSYAAEGWQGVRERTWLGAYRSRILEAANGGPASTSAE